MARYRVSNKNIYGFSTRVTTTGLLAGLAFLVTALLAQLVIGPALYPVYLAGNTLDDQEAGASPTAGTPVAQSIADMEKLERFTLVTTGVVLKYDTINDQGTIYHRLLLPSGEKVVARINQRNMEKTGEPGVYRLPVGCWREWPGEPPPAVMVLDGLLVTSHYVDMVGDYRPTLSEWDFSRGLANTAGSIVFLLCCILYPVWGVWRGKFAPAFFCRADPLLPRNDLELWCASAYALLDRMDPELEGWPLVTGAHRTRRAVANTKAALAAEHGITNGVQGLEAARRLAEPWAWETGDTRMAGWDLCRAMRLLAMLYHAGMLDRSALDQELSRTGKLAQRCFSSWEELTQSCLDGFDGRQRALAWDILLDLRATPHGPYSVPWRTGLSWSPEGGPGETEAVREVLSRYHVRD